MATWITNFTHLPPSGLLLPPAAMRRAEFTRAVVEAATSRRVRGTWRTAVRCIGHVARKRCDGRIDVERNKDAVSWACPGCGDCGLITNFKGSESDMSAFATRRKTVVWGFDDDERKVLLDASQQLPELRAIVARARCEPEVEGVYLVDATVEELDGVYSLVDELTDCTRSRPRLLLLEGMRFSLSTSIDGF